MSEQSLVFYTNPMSRGGIAQWMLEEVGEPYDIRVVEYGEPMKSDDYRAINPMGKVPAIVHDGRIVTEVAAICAYLADAFPEAGLAPAPADRADYYRWLFFAAGPVEAAVSTRACGFEPSEENQRMLGFGTLETTLDTLAGAVRGRRYIAGDRFSAADVYAGSHIGWGMQFGTIDERPEFVDYWNGLKDRPARLAADRFMREAMERAERS
ncbi:MAG: glutathione S-transferase [Gammaproteobacteria bacterium]|jgi:glutathione S-transferase|nr:glutathione S-transferase [Gammaproteobacteria bacterium]